MLNKYGILADLPERLSSDSEPWLVGYTAESIINWNFENINGKMVASRIVLKESWTKTDINDRFVAEEKDQYRVLELVVGDISARNMNQELALPTIDPGQKLIYRVQLWRLKKDVGDGTTSDKDEFLLHDEFFPAKTGSSMDRIPFVIVTAEDEDKEDQKPPLEGLASVNLSHYRSSADLEHGRHFTALPTPYVVGLSEQQDLVIGSARAWVVSGVNASEVKIGMLEFTGSGLSSLEKALEEKESQMARLGSRLLEVEKKAAEAFETHRLKSAGEQSILANVANGTSEGLNEALEWMMLWDPTLGEMKLQLNTEFVRIPMDAQTLTSFVGALQSGKISFKTFFFNMTERGMYPEEHTEEDEQGLLVLEAGSIDLDEEDDKEEEDDKDENKDDDKEEEEGGEE